MLEIQRLAVEFAVAGQQLARTARRHDAKLADQISRAATSTVLNLNEGIGRRQPADKRSRYDIALGECRECGAAGMLAAAYGYSDDVEPFLALADRMGAMLYRFREALDGWR